MDPAGIELTTSRLRQLRQLPVVQHVRFTPLKSRHYIRKVLFWSTQQLSCSRKLNCSASYGEKNHAANSINLSNPKCIYLCSKHTHNDRKRYKQFPYIPIAICENVNILRPKQNDCHSTRNIFKHIFLNENVWLAIKISLKFVSGCLIPALVQIMSWCRTGDKPSSESLMARLPTHISVQRPQELIIACW